MDQLLSKIQKKYSFILVSHSPRRSELLKRHAFKFKVQNGTKKLPEKVRNFFYLADIVRVTLAKVNSISAPKGKILIACDTIVVYNFRVFGKPKDKREAVSFLQKLSGKKHTVISCIAIKFYHNKHWRIFTALEKTKVYFRKLSRQEIAKYVQTKEPYDKAGGYGIQNRTNSFVRKIKGCYYNVVGLPIGALFRLLKKVEISK